MSRAVDQPRLISTALEGIRNAQKFYKDCSDGYWLWTAPEYVLCVEIAKTLNKIRAPMHVTLESNVRDTMSEANPRSRGAPPKKLRSGGRFDIVVWWGKGTPRAVIEVKNQVFSYRQISKDVERIASVIKRRAGESSFKFGCIAFYTSAVAKSNCTAKEMIENRLQRLLKQTKKHVPSVSVQHHELKIKEDGDSAWVPACIILKRSVHS